MQEITEQFIFAIIGAKEVELISLRQKTTELQAEIAKLKTEQEKKD